MGCKVDTLVERYGLTVPAPGYESVDEYLVARWTGADGRSADGYKPLTEWFNKRLLRRRYEDHGRDTVSVHLESEYEVIRGEASPERAELAADLATDGLDADELDDEMVSWSTMRHHLKGCLEAEKETQSAATDWQSGTVRVARERTEEKVQSVLPSLASAGRLPDADRSDVEVQVKLSCPDCSVRVPFEDALERGYVCETHLEGADSEYLEAADESDSMVPERVRNRLSGLAAPYVLVEVVDALLLGNTTVAELASVTVL